MKARISNVITESIIKSWKPKENILISAPMGSGKSYFCKNPLYKTAKDNNEKILMLIHRSNCVDQFAYEIVAAGWKQHFKSSLLRHSHAQCAGWDAHQRGLWIPHHSA